MGFIGYFVKLIHIPMYVPCFYSDIDSDSFTSRNNILVYGSQYNLLTYTDSFLGAELNDVAAKSRRTGYLAIETALSSPFLYPSILFGSTAIPILSTNNYMKLILS